MVNRFLLDSARFFGVRGIDSTIKLWYIFRVKGYEEDMRLPQDTQRRAGWCKALYDVENDTTSELTVGNGCPGAPVIALGKGCPFVAEWRSFSATRVEPWNTI